MSQSAYNLLDALQKCLGNTTPTGLGSAALSACLLLLRHALQAMSQDAVKNPASAWEEAKWR